MPAPYRDGRFGDPTIDAEANRITVGPRAALECVGLVTGPVNWLLPAPPAGGTRAAIKIRYQHVPAPGTLHPRADGGVEVRFDSPQAAVTPGQLAAFYDGDHLLGGATIERAVRESEHALEPVLAAVAEPAAGAIASGG